MENSFGIDNRIIKQALMNGIKIKKDNEIITVIGFIALVYMVQFNKFILTYGTTPADSGYVLVENFNKDWFLR